MECRFEMAYIRYHLLGAPEIYHECGMAPAFPPVGGMTAGSWQHRHFAFVLLVWCESGRV